MAQKKKTKKKLKKKCLNVRDNNVAVDRVSSGVVIDFSYSVCDGKPNKSAVK